MKSQRLAFLAVAMTSALLSGCNATMGELQQSADNLGKSLVAAVTPEDVTEYKAFNNNCGDLMLLVANTAKRTPGIAFPKGEFGKLQFRDSVGRTFAMDSIKTFRFPVPQDAIDADSHAPVAEFIDAIGPRLVTWNKTEAIELVAISNSTSGAAYLASQLRRTAPGMKVSEKVGPEAVVGYSGIELRMLNTSAVRMIAAK